MSMLRNTGFATQHWASGRLAKVSNVRVTDAKEVGVGNPAEETFCHPDPQFKAKTGAAVKPSRFSI